MNGRGLSCGDCSKTKHRTCGVWWGLARTHASRNRGAQSTKLEARRPPHWPTRIGVKPEGCRLIKLEFVAAIPLLEIGPTLKRYTEQQRPTSTVPPPPRHEVCSCTQHEKRGSK